MIAGTVLSYKTVEQIKGLTWHKDRILSCISLNISNAETYQSLGPSSDHNQGNNDKNCVLAIH